MVQNSPETKRSRSVDGCRYPVSLLTPSSGGDISTFVKQNMDLELMRSSEVSFFKLIHILKLAHDHVPVE